MVKRRVEVRQETSRDAHHLQTFAHQCYPLLTYCAYTSLFFTTNRAYAEKFGSRWVILSAKYGFIRPDFQIPGPYNVSFKDPATKPVEAPTLIDQIKELGLGKAQRVIGLGGKEYRAMIKEAFAPFGCPLSFPFAGLPIEEMIQATKGAIEFFFFLFLFSHFFFLSIPFFFIIILLLLSLICHGYDLHRCRPSSLGGYHLLPAVSGLSWLCVRWPLLA